MSDRLPVECGACGWTGRRKPGNIVECPKCGSIAGFQINEKPVDPKTDGLILTRRDDRASDGLPIVSVGYGEAAPKCCPTGYSHRRRW